MLRVWITTSTTDTLRPTAIALGNFDGIHRGHQRVLRPILANPSDTTYPTVVTFDPHPQAFFTGQSRQLLTPLAEKVKLLENLGIKQLVLLPFDHALAALSPQQFVETILVEQLHAKRISVGQDFRFGHRRCGNVQDLRNIAEKMGIEVYITDLQLDHAQSVRISSSLIRQGLAEGNMTHVNRMLGRNYALSGTVVQGQQLGRKLGFPTANLALPPEKLLPRYGVYGVRGLIDDSPVAMAGVMNIGCRPTVAGESPTVEVHLLDWEGDLYHRCLTVQIETFLRPEQKFPSLEALKTQIQADCDRARKILLSQV